MKNGKKKSKQKKSKQTELKSKDELLLIMNSHLVTQQEMAEKLRIKALKYIDKEDDDKQDKKQRNQYMYAYNQQVEAVSKSATTLIKIQNSSLKNGKELEEEEESDSLVD